MDTRELDISKDVFDTVQLLIECPEFYTRLTSLIGRYMTYVDIATGFITCDESQSFDMVTLSADRQECIISFLDVPRIKIAMSCGLFECRDTRVGEDWTFVNAEKDDVYVHFKTNTPEGKMIQLVNGVMPEEAYFQLSTVYDIIPKEKLELAANKAKSLLPNNQKITISITPLHEDEISTFIDCAEYLLGAYK